MRIIFLLLIGLFTGPVQAATEWHWEDHFSTREQQALKSWIDEVSRAISVLYGPLPYKQHVHFHRGSSWREPVPWARTDKSRDRAVHFYVDTRHSRDQFDRDWTASHELSHLMFPYVGEHGRWFAEGIASYLQYQIMYANDELNWREAVGRFANRFDAARRQGRGDSISIVALSRNPRGAFVHLYWGGAAYFLHADRRLQIEKGIRLQDVIKEYINCCYRRRGVNALDMIKTFDAISDSAIFTESYAETVARPGFPATEANLDWLRNNPPSLSE